MDEIDALVIVDMQKAYFEAEPLKSQRRQLAELCNQLIDSFATQQKPICMVRTVHRRDQSTWTLSMLDDRQRYLFEGDEHTALIDELNPTKSIEVVKLRDSAFFETDLIEMLRERNIQRIAICGVSTQNCILQTAVDAYSYNLRVTIVKDAIASMEPKFQNMVMEMLVGDYRQDIKTVRDLTT